MYHFSYFNLLENVIIVCLGFVLNSIMIVDYYFASQLPEGAISSLNYAYKLLSLVMIASGIVSVVYFTPISKLVAEKEYNAVRENFVRAFRITDFIAIAGIIAFIRIAVKNLQLLHPQQS